MIFNKNNYLHIDMIKMISILHINASCQRSGQKPYVVSTCRIPTLNLPKCPPRLKDHLPSRMSNLQAQMNLKSTLK